MGNSIAKNVSTNAINQALSISNNTLTTCNTNSTQSQNITIGGKCCQTYCLTDKDCNGGTCEPIPGQSQFGKCSNIGNCEEVVIFKDVNIDQFSLNQINASCMESGSTTSNINAQISQAASQLASAVNQSLDLNPGSTEAENIASNIINLMMSVQNTVQNQCFLNTVQQQSVNIFTCGHEKFNGININQESYNQAITNCVFSNSSVTSLQSALEQSITQSAKATVENSLGLLLTVIIIVVILFLLISFEAATWIIILVLILIIAASIYLIVAKIKGWWPFINHTTPLVTLNTKGTTTITKTTEIISANNPTLSYGLNSTGGNYQFTFTFDTPTQTEDLTITVDNNPPETYNLSSGTTQNSLVYPLQPGNHTLTLTSVSGITITEIIATATGVIDVTQNPNIVPGKINLTANKGWSLNLTGNPQQYTITVGIAPSTAISPVPTTVPTGTLTIGLGSQNAQITLPPKNNTATTTAINPGANNFTLQLLSTVPIQVGPISINPATG